MNSLKVFGNGSRKIKKSLYFSLIAGKSETSSQQTASTANLKASTLFSRITRGHENLFVCFQEDELGITLREVIGVDNIMFGSDYPHRESTWPNSRKVLAEVLKGVPEEEQEKIVYSNAARMYGFN